MGKSRFTAGALARIVLRAARDFFVNVNANSESKRTAIVALFAAFGSQEVIGELGSHHLAVVIPIFKFQFSIFKK